ncbi:MAG: DegV family protein [Lachnospiraceae bacterium]|nr:DegV family protein [Lachnospiraceae bacterium]
MTYKIFVDGYCELPEELKNNPHVSVIASGHEPKNIKIKKNSLFNRMFRGRREMLPSASPEQFRLALNSTDADMVFVLTVSDKYSTSYTQARIGKLMYLDEHPGAKIRVINTFTYGAGQGMVCKRLVGLCESGKKFGEISARLNSYLNNIFNTYSSPYARV